MLTFQSEDKKLLIWINGLTKNPDTLTQDELKQLRKNGDKRVTEASPDEQNAETAVAPPRPSTRRGNADAPAEA